MTGLVTCVPTKERCIDDDVALFGGNRAQIERLKKTIGLSRRRVVEDGTTAADLCERAARHLLAEEQAGGSGPVDALICVTQTPDYSQPCNAAVLHGRLQLPSACAALDVNLGCSGYVYGLWLAHSLIASGGCRRVLLLAGDTISRLVHEKDRSTAALFGDGGSATMVEAVAGAPESIFSLGTDGTGYDKLIVPAGGARRPPSAATREAVEDGAGNTRAPENLFMDGAEIFNFSITQEPRAVRELLDYAGLDLSEIDFFVFHQANRYILSNIAKRLKIDPAKVPMETVGRFGNQSSASIPCALASELGPTLREQKTRRVVLSGFGVGLSWASAVVSLGAMRPCAMVEFD
jgi:3-oxoacyl-[acyl-carrier-protein] synthase-3